jgi:hypothetical protein
MGIVYEYMEIITRITIIIHSKEMIAGWTTSTIMLDKWQTNNNMRLQT